MFAINRKPEMKILLLAAALFSVLSASPVSPGEKSDLQELFRSLDRVIARGGEYTARRESRIDSLKRALVRGGLSLRERFDLTERLAEDYNSYQSDFALLYLRRSLALAEETRRQRPDHACPLRDCALLQPGRAFLRGRGDLERHPRYGACQPPDAAILLCRPASHEPRTLRADRAGRTPRPLPPARTLLCAQRGENQRGPLHEPVLRVYGRHRSRGLVRGFDPLRQSAGLGPSRFPRLRQGRQPQGAARREGGAFRRGARMVHTFGHGRHPSAVA